MRARLGTAAHFCEVVVLKLRQRIKGGPLGCLWVSGLRSGPLYLRLIDLLYVRLIDLLYLRLKAPGAVGR